MVLDEDQLFNAKSLKGARLDPEAREAVEQAKPELL